MDLGSQRALLEAVARELSALAAKLPGDDDLLLAAREELAEACKAVEEAAQAWGPSGAAAGEAQLSDVLQEAQKLCAGAVRDRDVAEAQLQAVHRERGELLGRLASLTTGPGDGEVSQTAASGAADDREAEAEELQQRCEQLQQELLQKGAKLWQMNALGLRLRRRSGAFQKMHAKSTALSEASKEVLELGESTDIHVQQASLECIQIDEALRSEQEAHAERAELLRGEWSEQRRRHDEEAAALEGKRAAVRADYEEKWSAAEQDVRRRLSSKAQVATEAHGGLAKQLAEIDAQMAEQAGIRREKARQQERALAEAREHVKAEMEAKLDARRRELQAKIAEGRGRFARLAEQQRQRTEGLVREVEHYKASIGRVRQHYRGSLQQPDEGPLYGDEARSSSPGPGAREPWPVRPPGARLERAGPGGRSSVRLSGPPSALDVITTLASAPISP